VLQGEQGTESASERLRFGCEDFAQSEDGGIHGLQSIGCRRGHGGILKTIGEDDRLRLRLIEF
jgi:hypothetical protein